MYRAILPLLLIASACFSEDRYNRKDFNWHSYKPNTAIGFYTNQTCDFINIDHIVRLKDAYQSGAISWRDAKKASFANDRCNHVPSCGRVNSSNGSAKPKDFLRRSNEGKDLEYKTIRLCEYLHKYFEVKVKCGLSFEGNDKNILSGCSSSF